MSLSSVKTLGRATTFSILGVLLVVVSASLFFVGGGVGDTETATASDPCSSAVQQARDGAKRIETGETEEGLQYEVLDDGAFVVKDCGTGGSEGEVSRYEVYSDADGDLTPLISEVLQVNDSGEMNTTSPTYAFRELDDGQLVLDKSDVTPDIALEDLPQSVVDIAEEKLGE